MSPGQYVKKVEALYEVVMIVYYYGNEIWEQHLRKIKIHRGKKT